METGEMWCAIFVITLSDVIGLWIAGICVVIFIVAFIAQWVKDMLRRIKRK